MDDQLSRDRIRHRFDGSGSLEEFLAGVDEDGRKEIRTVYVNKSSDAGDVVLVGGVHCGRKTRQVVDHLITKHEPEHVAVELSRGQYHLLKHCVGEESPLEMKTAIDAAERVGARSHPIDKSRLWMRATEALHGSGERRANALVQLAKRVAPLLLLSTAPVWWLLGESLLALACLAVVALTFVQWGRNLGNQATRNYDYAVIALVTNVSTGVCRAKELVTRRRDEHMAERIEQLRDGGDVIAVVGFNHLAGIKSELNEDEWVATNFDLD